MKQSVPKGGKGERDQTGASTRLDLTACPGVGVAIKMRPRQTKHNINVCVYIYRMCYMGPVLLVLYVYICFTGNVA